MQLTNWVVMLDSINRQEIKMHTEILQLKNGEIALDFDSFENLRIQTAGSRHSVPFDIVIKIFGASYYFEDFADYYKHKIDGKEPQYEPEIFSVIEKKFHPFCALIGINKVIFVNFTDKSINKILSLYRKETEDEGFYWMDVNTKENYFLIIYESGIAKISNDGNVEWHKSMRWDDIYIKSDEYYLYYSSEYRDKEEWKLDIITGQSIDSW